MTRKYSFGNGESRRKLPMEMVFVSKPKLKVCVRNGAF
jgi:hypothetical protein